jgi:D-alanine-D-alanine ligase-like ATP-grasp enzyme
MFKTIQGLNLESEITLVEITLEGTNTEEISKIIDEISSFHSIFIHSYKISPTLLTIYSKLPFLWRELANKFNKLSKQELTYKEVRTFTLDELIARRIKSMSTITLLEEAQKKGLEITPAVLQNVMYKSIKDGYRKVLNRYYVLGCGKGSQISSSIASTKDTYFAQNIQRDKWSTNIMIERLGLPIPKWCIIKSLKELESMFPKYSKPIVMKPTGLTGGHGVTVGINNLEQAKKAFSSAKNSSNNKTAWQTKIMIQEQIQGDDYRLLVIDGKLEIATKRIPAFVVGDNKLTIQQLIENTNKDSRRDIANPTHILKPIVIDTPLKDYLKEQNLSLHSVPKKNEKIPLRKVASMSQGGITEDFTDKVSTGIKKIVETLAQSVHAFTLGVDIICLDISKPLTKDNGGIIEINTMPESYLNFFPAIGKQRKYVADTYFNKLLSENTCKKYVLVGKPKNNILNLLSKRNLIKQCDTIGEVIGNCYYIDSALINKDLNRWEITEGIKCNGSLDVIILHFKNWKEVQEYGLGFDSIHTLFVTKENSINKKCMKIMKKYKNKKLINNIKII